MKLNKILFSISLAPVAMMPMVSLASCAKKYVAVTAISAHATPFKPNKNSQVYCKCTFEPSDATNKNLAWTIEDGLEYASIDRNTGILTTNSTCVSGNKIRVRATSKDNPTLTAETEIEIDTTADKDNYETYIHDRSFSLLGSGTYGSNRYMAWGTAWIISDATPDNTNDYEYYIATNWHVILGHDEVKSETRNYKTYFGDDTKSSGLSVLDDYTEFTSYQKEATSNFIFKKNFWSADEIIDFYVAKANFASATGSCKTKLNKLNDLQKTKGYITQFANTTSDTSVSLPSEVYIGGYPVQNQYYATWEHHELSSSKMTYAQKGEKPHTIGENNQLNDVSPQFIYTQDMGSSWMKGGASGSMLVGKFDGTYKVCAIYWGGWTNSAQTALYPSFSIFNSSDKNFIYSYIL